MSLDCDIVDGERQRTNPKYKELIYFIVLLSSARSEVQREKKRVREWKSSENKEKGDIS